MDFPHEMVSFKYNGVEHSAKALHDIILHECIDLLLQMALRILLAHILDRQLFGCHFLLILQCL